MPVNEKKYHASNKQQPQREKSVDKTEAPTITTVRGYDLSDEPP